MEFSWKQFQRLDEEYGDSYYLMDVGAFEANYHELLGAFRKFYPNTCIAYSYKTNYTPRLCRSVLSLGGFAEVVSSLEYELALRIGVPPDRIIFNGPYKSRNDLERALLSGSVCNLDDLYEIEVVEEIARNAGTADITVGLRCNLAGVNRIASRFGFDAGSHSLAEAIKKLRRIKNCNLGGLHFHSSAGDRDVESYQERTRGILKLSSEHFGNAGPRFINLGGGYLSKMPQELRQQFKGPIPTFRDYAAAVAAQVAEYYGGSSCGPQLIIEPGSALTADVMRFVAKIVSIKQVGTRTVALASGSIQNIKPTLHNKRVPMEIYGCDGNPAPRQYYKQVDIVGYTCMEHDILFESYSGAIGRGDYAVFDNLGAYTIVMKPPFIRPAPSIISPNSSTGGFDVLKRREDAADIFSTFSFDVVETCEGR
jgi:diaminopimelate decarboxylase